MLVGAVVYSGRTAEFPDSAARQIRLLTEAGVLLVSPSLTACVVVKDGSSVAFLRPPRRGLRGVNIEVEEEGDSAALNFIRFGDFCGVPVSVSFTVDGNSIDS